MLVLKSKAALLQALILLSLRTWYPNHALDNVTEKTLRKLAGRSNELKGEGCLSVFFPSQ